MNDSETTPNATCNKFKAGQAFDRSSFVGSLRSSIMSRGLSILFRTSDIFTDEEENEILKNQPFANEELLQEITVPPTIFLQDSFGSASEPTPFSTPPQFPQPNTPICRLVSAPDIDVSTRSSESVTPCARMSASSDSAPILEEPGQWDIVCGRNSGGFHCIGNRRFRITMLINLPRYLEAPTREEKSQVIKSIVRTLQDDVGARFVRRVNKNQYKPLNNKEVRDKIAHTMRDMVQEHKRNDDQQFKLPCSPLQSNRKLRRGVSVDV